MNDDTFNMSVRKFLKAFGINAQREIEQSVARAIATGKIRGSGALPAKITLKIADLALETDFKSQIDLG